MVVCQEQQLQKCGEVVGLWIYFKEEPTELPLDGMWNMRTAEDSAYILDKMTYDS